jgi:hypothetical protein
MENLSNLRLTFEKVNIVEFVVHDTLVETEVVVFEIKVAADLKRVGLGPLELSCLYNLSKSLVDLAN